MSGQGAFHRTEQSHGSSSIGPFPDCGVAIAGCSKRAAIHRPGQLCRPRSAIERRQESPRSPPETRGQPRLPRLQGNEGCGAIAIDPPLHGRKIGGTGSRAGNRHRPSGHAGIDSHRPRSAKMTRCSGTGFEAVPLASSVYIWMIAGKTGTATKLSGLVPFQEQIYGHRRREESEISPLA